MDRKELETLSKAELVELVLKLQRPAKTSQTSSKPPSTDRKARREQAKPGGAKPGHKGFFRALTETPDSAIDHRPERCSDCGHVFGADAPGDVVGEYDAIDLPPIAPVTTRHRRFACLCPACGGRTKAPPPPAASGSPFAPSVGTLAFYFKHFQHLSYQRLEAMFRDVFGLSVSQGALGNMFTRGGAAFAAGKAEALARLRQAEAVASDETGVRIEGVNAQQWVFRSADVVLHEVAFSRGADVVRDVMGGHRPRFWTSDRYSAQQNHADRQQTCLAHLVRDVAWGLEVSDDPAPFRLKLWFNGVFALARGLGDYAAATIQRRRRALESELADILRATSDCDVARALLRKIANAREQLLTFLDAPHLVDPTNNDCERALRPAVVHRKVTNGFRSHRGAQTDAAVRTVVDTRRLTGANPFQVIQQTLAV
jgi:transposase